MIFVISPIKLGRFWWNLVHRFLNKVIAKLCKQFPSHLNSVSTLYFELVEGVLPVVSLQKETPEFIPHHLRPPNLPVLNPIDYSMWGILQENVYKIPITDLNKLKQRLRTEWAGPTGSCRYFGSHLSVASLISSQGRPVSVKHGARCAMSKVGGDKNPEGDFNVLL